MIAAAGIAGLLLFKPGAAVLLSDLLRVGSGRWSVNYWLSQKFEAAGKSGSKR